MFLGKPTGLWLFTCYLADRLRHDSLLRNSVFIMSSTVVTSAIGYLYWVLAARIYSAYDVGFASAILSIMTLASTFANVGIGSALVQLLPQRKTGYEWSLTLNICLAIGILTSLLGGTIVALVLPLVSPQFALTKFNVDYILLFIVGVVLCTITTLLDQTFIAERASNHMAVRNAVFALLKLLILALLVQVGALGIFSSWILAFAATIIFAVLVLLPRLKRGYRPVTRGIMKQIQPLLSSFAGQHFINIGGLLPMYLLPTFVAVRLSVTENAYFYTTWMLGSLFFMVSSSVATALFSEGSHVVDDIRRKVRTSALIICILLSLILLIFLFGGGSILSLFGPNYAQYGVSLLLILMLSSVPDAITNIYVSVLRVRRRLRSAALLNLSMATITLVLAWILLPMLGIAGAGWAWLIAQSCGSLAVGTDMLFSRKQTAQPHQDVPRQSVLQQLTLRNAAGLYRYILLCLRFHHLRGGLFFIDRGADIHVSSTACIRFGRGIRFMRDFTGHFFGNVTIGDQVFFNRGCYVAVNSSLTIGNYCLFGEGVSIHDQNHVVGCGPEPIATRGFVVKPITIGNNVWVGAKATILPGVHIGDNAVVGANAVVTHDVPANTIVGGIPARVLRKIEPSSSSSVATQHSSDRDAPADEDATIKLPSIKQAQRSIKKYT